MTHWELTNVRFIFTPFRWYRPRIALRSLYFGAWLGPLQVSFCTPRDLPAGSLEKVVLDNLVSRANDRLRKMRGAG